MQTSLTLSRFWLGIGWLLVGLVLYLSLTPHPPAPLAFDNADKLEHACAYAALSFWFCQFYRKKWSRVRVMIALLVLGIAIEYIQGWTGYRTFDVLDMLAGGATETEILTDYPYLEREDIQACLEYAAAQVDHAVVAVP